MLQVASGNFLEMYDFFVFAYYAAAIGKAYFPSGNETAQLMLSLATFGVGFLVRPLGLWSWAAIWTINGRRGVDPDAGSHVGRHLVGGGDAWLCADRCRGAADRRGRPSAAGLLGRRGAWRRVGLPVRDRDARTQGLLRQLAICQPAGRGRFRRFARGCPAEYFLARTDVRLGMAHSTCHRLPHRAVPFHAAALACRDGGVPASHGEDHLAVRCLAVVGPELAHRRDRYDDGGDDHRVVLPDHGLHADLRPRCAQARPDRRTGRDALRRPVKFGLAAGFGRRLGPDRRRAC